VRILELEVPGALQVWSIRSRVLPPFSFILHSTKFKTT
jgi:hypothetical protein